MARLCRLTALFAGERFLITEGREVDAHHHRLPERGAVRGDLDRAHRSVPPGIEIRTSRARRRR